ncbi:MAG TPA: chemotaxis protein CheW [Gemmataceae bacterium]|nr:chemotaxis protein CheW [Gemmataceae bacterium]
MTQTAREILVFEIGGQRYGLPVADVRELLRAVTLTPLPQAPAIVEGIINVRGTIVPVLDIRRRFRLPARAPEHTDHLIVASAGGRLVALRVDHALEVTRLAAANVDRAEAVLPGVDYVAEVAKCPDGLVLIHDLQTFLSASEVTLLAEVLANAEGSSP